MMKSTLPLRFRVLQYASLKDDFNCKDLLTDLKEEYGGEGQFTKKMLTTHLDSLRAVGMINNIDVGFDENEELTIQYKITDYGRSRLSYLPDGWK